MMWLVLRALQHYAPRVFEELTWKLLWNSSEECSSPDFGTVCRSRFDRKTLAALVFEAEGREKEKGLLVVGRKGRGTWRVMVSGRGAHAGGKHRQGANAALQLGLILPQIASLTDYSRNLTFNIGRISGGTVLNRVPHEAVAEGEFRAFTAEVYAQAKASLLAIGGMGTVRSPQDNFGCQIQGEGLSECKPWPRNENTDRLFALWKETADALGLPLGAEERGGLSDGNLFWDVVPTLDGLGPCGDNDHCSERTADGSKLPEFVQISSFVPKAALNTLALLALVERSAASL